MAERSAESPRPALILRSAAGASRRMLQLVPEPPETPFETPLTRLLRMRAEFSREAPSEPARGVNHFLNLGPAH